jgi:DNA-binding transcriptional MocR family regulator
MREESLACTGDHRWPRRNYPRGVRSKDANGAIVTKPSSQLCSNIDAERCVLGKHPRGGDARCGQETEGAATAGHREVRAFNGSLRESMTKLRFDQIESIPATTQCLARREIGTMTQLEHAASAESCELAHLPTEALRKFRDRQQATYEAIKARALPFNLARGKPASEQVTLANQLLIAVATPEECWAEDGTDCRNYYGSPQGLIEARRLFAPMLGAPAEQVLVANNSSLALMHDAVVYALLTGARDGAVPWRDQRRPIRFLCPSPGYDRHFQICEQYGIEMIPVALTGAGPNMDEVEELAADPSVKGMWCVPKYSNPTGETYSSETVARLARMSAADDFRLFWDNAYAVHHLTDTPDPLDNVLDVCAAAGNPDRALVFGSTSKITFAQAGLGLFATSRGNMRWFVSRLSTRTIGPDKLNQLRHVRVLRNDAGIAAHMTQHRRLLAPKFAAVLETFETRLGGRGVATWTRPRGGYFVSLDVLDGCAQRVVALAKAAGIETVPAGRTFPYGRDPRDRNIRIAPSFPPAAEVGAAAEALATCVLVATCERLLAIRGVNG